MSSFARNTQSQSSYMSAGSNPGADVVNFRFHITDINASLQSSSVVSVENDQMMPCGNKGAKCEGAAELSAKIKILQTKYKNLLKPDAVESQKIVYLRDINRTYEYLQLVEGKVSWSKVEETVDADMVAYEDECQDDWAIHDDLYDEEQEIFEQLEYHFEGFECPVEIVNAHKAREAAHRALLDDVNQYLVEHYACIGCGNPDVKYTACGGIEGRNMCEECWT